jgi:hypothetical protein
VPSSRLNPHRLLFLCPIAMLGGNLVELRQDRARPGRLLFPLRRIFCHPQVSYFAATRHHIPTGVNYGPGALIGFKPVQRFVERYIPVRFSFALLFNPKILD